MKFNHTLICGTLIRLYKRLLLDVEIESDETITAHCPNSGSLLGLGKSWRGVMLSKHINSKPKDNFALELVNVNRIWVGINTMLPNLLVEEAIKSGRITELQGYTQILREKK
jgi:sugar fermentation stimulation protein A